ncbi:MAG: pyrophosphatase [Paenibacillaceae bacterium ZCTH02-B3]|nr:MAG: pyrophosphatase [Paenibacillaceae bacterium ZCTH02-B3]
MTRTEAPSRPGLVFTTVLFDLDGTILDTNELIIQSFLHALRGVVPPDFGREQIIPLMGQPLVSQMRIFTGREEVADLVRAYREYNLAHHDRMVKLFPGVAETLDVLKKSGIRTGVVTTKMRETSERALKLFGLWDKIDVLVGIDDVAHPKPDPEPVLKAMQAVGAEPARTLMVGDSPVDMEAALRAGAVPAGVAWSLKGEAKLREAGAVHLLGRMEDLRALCGIGVAQA